MESALVRMMSNAMVLESHFFRLFGLANHSFLTFLHLACGPDHPCDNGGTCNVDGTCSCINRFLGARCSIGKIIYS